MNENAEGNPWACSVRVERQKGQSYRGQNAHDLRTQTPDYVDASLSPWNSFLVTPPPEAELFAECERRWSRRNMRRRRGLRRDANIGISGIITFGHELQPQIDALPRDEQDRRYHQLAEILAAELNTDIVGLVVHRDESGPHAHFTLCGYTPDGYSVTESLTPSRLKKLQDLAAGDLYADLGAQRGNSKAQRLQAGAKPSEVIHKSVRQLHQQLPADLAEARARVENVQEHVSALTTERDSLQQQLDTMTQERNVLASQIEQKHQELIEAQDKAAEARNRSAVAEQKQAHAETNAYRHQADAAKHQRASLQMEKRAQKAHARAEKHEKRAKDAAQEIEQLKKREKELQDQISALNEARTARWQPDVPDPSTFKYHEIKKDRSPLRGGPVLEARQLKAYPIKRVRSLARQHEEAIKQSRAERDAAVDQAEDQRRMYRDLVLQLTPPTPAGSPHDDLTKQDIAKHTATAPCEQRYGVIVRHDEQVVTIPKQPASQQQIASALYRSCRERFGDDFNVWGITDEAAEKIAEMAAEDGVLVTVTDNQEQNQLVESAFIKRTPATRPVRSSQIDHEGADGTPKSDSVKKEVRSPKQQRRNRPGDGSPSGPDR